MLSVYLYFTSGVVLLLAAIFLFFRTPTLALKFLAGHLLILSVGTFTRTLIATGMIIDYPHVYNVVLPFQFLYGPFYYLFALYLLKQHSSFNYLHWLHFLPFFINLFDFIPFYFLNAEVKRELIQSRSDISFLGIPHNVYNAFKSLSYILYVAFVGRLFSGYILNTNESYLRKAKRANYWLTIDYFLKIVTVITGVYIVFIQQQEAFTWSFYLFNLDAFFNIVVLAMWPALINGLPAEYGKYSVFSSRFSRSHFSTWFSVWFKRNWKEDQLLNYLDNEFNQQALFLNHLFDKFEMCRMLKINLDDLETIIYSNYKCSISEFIEFKRIQYVLTKIETDAVFCETPVYKVAYLAGFDSLVAFQAAYLKFKSVNHHKLLKYDEMAVKKLDNSFQSFFSQSD